MPDLSTLTDMFHPQEAQAKGPGPMRPNPITPKDYFLSGLKGYKITPKPKLPISIPKNQLPYYRQELDNILKQSKKDWKGLTQEEALEQSGQEGQFVKARVSNLRRRLGVDPWPRGNKILNGEVE